MLLYASLSKTKQNRMCCMCVACVLHVSCMCVACVLLPPPSQFRLLGVKNPLCFYHRARDPPQKIRFSHHRRADWCKSRQGRGMMAVSRAKMAQDRLKSGPSLPKTPTSRLKMAMTGPRLCKIASRPPPSRPKTASGRPTLGSK